MGAVWRRPKGGETNGTDRSAHLASRGAAGNLARVRAGPEAGSALAGTASGLCPGGGPDSGNRNGGDRIDLHAAQARRARSAALPPGQGAGTDQEPGAGCRGQRRVESVARTVLVLQAT